MLRDDLFSILVVVEEERSEFIKKKTLEGISLDNLWRGCKIKTKSFL